MKHDFNTLHLGWAIRNIPKNIINGHEKSILLILLLSTGQENISWYSLQSIADMTCFSLDTVRRNLKMLEQKKFITINKPSSYSRSISNHYSLNVDEIMIYSKLEKDSPQQPLNAKKGSWQQRKGSWQQSGRVADSTTKKEREERKEETRARASEEAAPDAREVAARKEGKRPDFYKIFPERWDESTNAPLIGVAMPDEVREALIKMGMNLKRYPKDVGAVH